MTRAAAAAAGGFLVLYVATVVLLHDGAQAFFLRAQASLGRSMYTVAAVTVNVLFFAMLSVALARTRRHVVLLYWAYVLALAAASYFVLVAVATETIHFLQFGIVALPVHALCRRKAETIVWVTLIGLVDEAWQYFVLHADWGIYLDFNDVVLNAIGAGMAVVLIAAVEPLPAAGELEGSRQRDTHVHASDLRDLRGPVPGSLARFLRSLPVVLVLLLVLASTSLWASGLLRIFPADDGVSPLVLLSRAAPAEAFWTIAEWSHKRFHVLHPVLGTLLALGIGASFIGLDRFAGSSRSS